MLLHTRGLVLLSMLLSRCWHVIGSGGPQRGALVHAVGTLVAPDVPRGVLLSLGFGGGIQMLCQDLLYQMFWKGVLLALGCRLVG
jgi:hypothetical protein